MRKFVKDEYRKSIEDKDLSLNVLRKAAIDHFESLKGKFNLGATKIVEENIEKIQVLQKKTKNEDNIVSKNS